MTAAALLAALCVLAARLGACEGAYAPPATVSFGLHDYGGAMNRQVRVLRWINSRDDLLPNTTITWRKSAYGATRTAMLAPLALAGECNPAVRVDVMAGAPWSTQALLTAKAAASLDLPFFNGAAFTAQLSDKSVYPTTVRTYPSDGVRARAFARVCLDNGWRRVGIFSRTGQYTTSLAASFRSECEAAGINVVLHITMDKDTPQEDVNTRMGQLRAADVRVVLVSMEMVHTSRVMRAALLHGMVGPKNAWLMSSAPSSLANAAYYDQWPAWDGAVTLSVHVETNTTANRELDAFIAEDILSAWALRAFGGNTDRFKFDMLFLAARALDLQYTEEGRCSEAAEPAADEVCEFLAANATSTERVLYFARRVSFDGFTGRIDLDENGDTSGTYTVRVVRVASNSSVNYTDPTAVPADTLVSVHAIGHASASAGTGGDVSIVLQEPMTFYGNSTVAPLDGPRYLYEEIRVGDAQLVGTSAVSGLVALAALALVAFTLRHRNRKIIRMSSPHINNLSSLGCAAACGVVAAWGLSPDTDARCTARQWSLPLAFTLIFGPLFAKIYRVNAIFNASNLRVKAVRDKSLFAGVGAMLLVDAALLTAWTAAHPLRSTTRELPAEDLGDDLVNRPYVHECGGEHSAAWFGAVVAYKAALMVAGAVLAYKVRNVNIAALNDAKWVGFAIYNWVMAMAFGLPVAASLGDQPATLYAMTAGTLLFAVVGTLALVHGPKLYAIVTGTEDAWVQDASSQKTAQSAAANASKRHRRAQSGKTAPRGGRAVGPALELPRLVSAGELASSAPGSPRTPPPPLETLSEIEGEA